MKRRLIKLLVAASLVMCVAIVAVWLRSYWTCDEFAYQSEITGANSTQWHVDVQWSWGRVLVRKTYVWGLDRAYAERGGWDITRHPLKPILSQSNRGKSIDFPGVKYWQTYNSCSPASQSLVWWTQTYFSFPLWQASLVFSLAPLAWIGARLRDWRRVNEGCCTNCGYDLRATPARCPECGLVRQN